MALPTDEELARIREDARRFTALTLRTASEVESEARAFAIDRARQSRPYFGAPNVIRFPIERTHHRRKG